MIEDDSHIMSSAALAAQPQFQALEQRANELTYEALGLSQAERYLVRDLVHDKLQLLGGKIQVEMAKAPDERAMKAYAETLKGELDTFVAVGDDAKHRIQIHPDQRSAIVAIRLGGEYPEGGAIRIRTPSAELSVELAGLRQRLLSQRAR